MMEGVRTGVGEEDSKAEAGTRQPNDYGAVMTRNEGRGREPRGQGLQRGMGSRG